MGSRRNDPEVVVSILPAVANTLSDELARSMGVRILLDLCDSILLCWKMGELDESWKCRY